MRTIQDIYDQYQIMPVLQLHQLRVAAVAAQICRSLSSPVDIEGIINACLIHDMGNIIKFNLESLPKLLEPEGLRYWQTIQAQTKTRYGSSEEAATLQIARELGASDTIRDYITAFGFTKASDTLARPNLEPKICYYADKRVTPFGVVSLDNRLVDGRERYKDRSDRVIETSRKDRLTAATYDIEKQVFAHTSLKPSDITDASVSADVLQFRQRQLQVS